MDFTRLEEIHSGWSGDQKYHAWDSSGREVFLRVCPIEKETHLHQARDLQQRAWEAGLPVCQPLGFQRQDSQVCIWESWCNGENARQALPHFSLKEQHRLGLEAGKALAKLHQLPTLESFPPWEQVCQANMRRKVRGYLACPIHYEKGELLIAFVESHLDLLKGRTTRWLHGDYHDSNMLVADGHLIIIDFDRCNPGDPWKEFSRLPWCAQISPLFASGMLQGYFNGDPPEDFWQLLALYIASNCLSALPWALPFGEGEIATMKQQAAEVLDWYDGMRRIIPSWYQAWQEAL